MSKSHDAAGKMPKSQLADFCRRHHIRKFSLFGSILRDDFRPDSDVDVLVEFEPGHTPGFITLSAMRLELMELFGREVDLMTPASISRHFRQKVLETAQVQYERQ
jgi:hypothetical protein